VNYNTSIASTPYAVGVAAARITGFFAGGSVEGTFFFVRSGGLAARTNEINVHFRPAVGASGIIVV
jgi:hypothetical protein